QSTSAALVRDPTRLASFPADWMSQLYDREAGEGLAHFGAAAMPPCGYIPYGGVCIPRRVFMI
ncbi:MAG: hypothetical protein E7J94_13085, partial [Clostridium sp.]|nr:hypothetical protein [Clostridium sp.]